MRKIYLSKKTGEQSRFWDENWENHSLESLLKEVQSNFMRPIFEKYFPREGKILEAGCGLGKFLIYYRKQGYDIEGVDFAEETVNRVKKYDPELPLRLENLTQLSSKDNFYKLYYSGGVFEHFENSPLEVLKEAARVLKKDGLLIISVPYINLLRRIEDIYWFFILNKKEKTGARVNREKFMYRLTEKCAADAIAQNLWQFHEYMYTKREIEKILNNAGFEAIYVKPVQCIWGIKTTGLVLHRYNQNSKSHSVNNIINWLKKHLFCENEEGFVSKIVVGICGIFFAHQIVLVCRKNE